MLKNFIALICLLTLTACGGASNPNAGQPMQVADRVQLSAYQGLWYEIASIPSGFQAGCSNTTARYTPAGENRVEVLNRCRLGGGVNAIEGFAVAEATDSAILSVDLRILGLFNTGGSPYWVLAVGPIVPDGLYEWAVVGNPSRSFGWILSRKPTLGDREVAQAQAVLTQNGYDLDDFRFDPQDRPFTE